MSSSRHDEVKTEGFMPLTSIFILSAIVVAFALFAAVLAWSEHQTRHWRQSAPSSPENEREKLEQPPTASNSHRELTAA
jgi:multisubunit Na+/H+ antiporter MnhC subunit